ncbi:MAG: tetratricopeptide repeat protein [Deltaproteobacteria bacterium]|nr:tetratricopeptide repeat protein [Deltaproteobacteria bacterium]
MKKRTLLLLLALCSMLLATACSFPRVIVLKDPLTPEEHLNLGVTYEQQGDFDNAIKEYRLAAKNLPRANLYLGNAYFQKREWKEAEDFYRKAIEAEPDNADAHNNLAWLYYTRKENLEQAEGLAQKAVELNPGKGDVYRDTLEKIRELRKGFPK